MGSHDPVDRDALGLQPNEDIAAAVARAIPPDDVERTALVVDDDADARILARMALEHAGWKVELASNAIEALAKVKSGHFDVLTLDLRMPGVDGYELLPQLRSSLPGIPIVVISAEPRNHAATTVLRLGASDYVEKPFHIDELTARVDRLHEDAERHEEVVLAAAESLDLLETLPSINLRLRESGTITWVSTTIATALGHDPTTLIGESLDSLVRDPEADHATVAAALARPRTTQESRLELRTADGSWQECNATTVAVHNVTTGSVEVRRTVIPVSTIAAPALRSHHESSCDTSPLPTAALTLDGVIVAVNDHFARFLGFDPHAVVGLRHQAFVHPDDANELSRVESELRQPGSQPIDLELRYVGGDGRVRWTHLIGGRLAANQVTGEAEIIAHFLDVDSKHRALASALIESLRDPLTGLPNRAVLTDRLEHTLAGLPGRGRQVTVLFIDLDHLKEVNDSLGHQAGDHLLSTIGTRLGNAARATDTVARIGGDEFVIVASDLDDVERAERYAHRILEVIAEPIAYGTATIECTASIGIARTRDNRSVRALLDEADAEMYRSKHAGRDRYSIDGKPPVGRVNPLGI